LCTFWKVRKWTAGNSGITATYKLLQSYRDTERTFYGKQTNGIRSEKLSHINAVASSIHFINFMENKVQPVDSLLHRATAKQIDENRHILKSIFKSIVFCAQQNIAFTRRS